VNAKPDIGVNDFEREPQGNGAGNDSALRLQTLSEFVTRPVVSNQIRGIDPGQAIVVLFGPPKEGKTFSVADLTMHAAHGLDWHGFRIRKALKVAYLVGEGINGFRVRLKAWLEQHDTLDAPPLFRVFPAPLPLPVTVEAVIEMLREFAPDVVVTDTLNAYFGAGDESKTQDMTVFCNAVRSLRDRLHCSVYVIHHTGQGEQGRERGSIVLRATADVLVQIAKDLGGSGLVGFQVISARDIEVMQEPLSLRLSMVQTEWLDDDGLPMSTCLVSRADEPVTLTGRGPRPSGEAKKKKAGDNQIKATIALKEWARANPDDNLITSIDIRALLKAQKLDERRRPEVLKYFVDIHVLTASVGGYTIDRQML
jgi:hypothetical protein